MGIIIDSCVWVSLGQGAIEQEDVITVTGDDPVFISVISLGELQFGVESCRNPAERAVRAAYLRQLEARPTLGITPQTAAAFGVLAAAMKESGRSPRPRYNDLWIGAQAIEHGYAVLTLNTADFSGMPGLHVLRLPKRAKKE